MRTLAITLSAGILAASLAMAAGKSGLPADGSKDLERMQIEAIRVRAERINQAEEARRQSELESRLAKEREQEHTHHLAKLKYLQDQLNRLLDGLEKVQTDSSDSREEAFISFYEQAIPRAFSYYANPQGGEHNWRNEPGHDEGIEMMMDLIASRIAELLPRSAYREPAKPSALDVDKVGERIGNLTLLADLIAHKSSGAVYENHLTDVGLRKLRWSDEAKKKSIIRGLILVAGFEPLVWGVLEALFPFAHAPTVSDHIVAAVWAFAPSLVFAAVATSSVRALQAKKGEKKVVDKMQSEATEMKTNFRAHAINRFLNALERRTGIAITADAREAMISGDTKPMRALFCEGALGGEPARRVRVAESVVDAEQAEYDDRLIDEVLASAAVSK